MAQQNIAPGFIAVSGRACPAGILLPLWQPITCHRCIRFAIVGTLSRFTQCQDWRRNRRCHGARNENNVSFATCVLWTFEHFEVAEWFFDGMTHPVRFGGVVDGENLNRAQRQQQLLVGISQADFQGQFFVRNPEPSCGQECSQKLYNHRMSRVNATAVVCHSTSNGSRKSPSPLCKNGPCSLLFF